jgi:2-methylisocitrate lyase-like PEP mutase family enzyme
MDIESGYGQPAPRLIDGLLSVGAVGLNIEDTAHSEGKRLRSAGEQAVINVRTDLFLRQDGLQEGGASDRVERAFEGAVARLTEAAAVGADVLYPVGRHDLETLRRLATELPLLGVGRISFGPFLRAALADRAQDLPARWAEICCGSRQLNPAGPMTPPDSP